MNTSTEECILRKLVHIQIRPTYTVINNLTMLLKTLGYQDIPKLQTQDYYSVPKENIHAWCNLIKDLITYEPDGPVKKNTHTSKEVFMFQELSLLPKNVYVSEKDAEEHNVEDNFNADDISSVSESENSENSEKEEHEEGYEFYSEDEEDEFSD